MGGVAEEIEKALEQIRREKPRLVVVEIDSPGGSLETCDKLSNLLLHCGVPTVALILHEAISGGAVLASACNEIIMVRGSQIGDIQPMMMVFGTSLDERSAEKIESKVRAIVKANANANGHPQEILAAMVSRDIELYEVVFDDDTREFLTKVNYEILKANIESGREKRRIRSERQVVAAGKLLELGTADAVRYGLAKAVVESREAFYKTRGIDLAQDVVTVEVGKGEFDLTKFGLPADLPTWKVVLLAIFLIIGIAGVLAEMHLPGFGIPGACGIIGFGCFFLLLFLHGRAEWYEIALFLVGVILLVIEIVVLPGFGITGITGILCILAGLLLAFLPEWSTLEHHQDLLWNDLGRFVWMMLFVLVGISILVWLIVAYGAKLPFCHYFYHKDRLRGGDEVLATIQAEDAKPVATTADPLQRYIGKRGRAVSLLRPAGKIRLDGEETILDVVTEGVPLDPGTPVIVLRATGNHLVVGPLPPENQPPSEEIAKKG